MSKRLALRPRSSSTTQTPGRGAAVVRRSNAKRPVTWFSGLNPTPTPSLATSGPAPYLVFAEEAGDRDAWVSGGLSAGLHVLVLAALIAAALLTPEEVVQRIIPLQLRREAIPLPGSNATPAPAGPKAVGATRPSAAALAAAAAPALSAAEAEALRRAALEAARAALEAMESQQPITAPTQIERNQVQADTVAARAAAAETMPSVIVAGDDLKPLDIDAADLAALDLGELDGPREIDTSSFGALSAPEAFAALEVLEGREYTGAASLGGVATGASMAGGAGGGNGVDTGLSAEWSGTGRQGAGGGGGGAGGAGTATGSVPCLESAYVQRYLEAVRDRTNQHWIVPEGVAPNAQVKLRFALDDAGMASHIETLDAEEDLLARSAETALRWAAPFPPMDDHNRCLSADRIRLTFTVPQD